MAEIVASDIYMYIKRSTDLQFRSVVCITDAGTSTTKSSTTVDTRCGTVTATGSSDTTFTGTGVVTDTPAATEISYMEMRAIAEADEEFEIVVQNESGSIYIGGVGKITDISDTATQGQMMTFTYTVKINGTLDLSDAS